MTTLGEAVDAAIAAAEPAGIAIGDTVISWNVEEPITYGGPDEHGSVFVLVIGVGTGGMTVLCPPDRVAPVGTPLADAKDPRIQIVKRKGPSWHGNWWLEVPGLPGSYHKTKREATSEGQRRLAIADWHAARNNNTD